MYLLPVFIPSLSSLNLVNPSLVKCTFSFIKPQATLKSLYSKALTPCKVYLSNKGIIESCILLNLLIASSTVLRVSDDITIPVPKKSFSL